MKTIHKQFKQNNKQKQPENNTQTIGKKNNANNLEAIYNQFKQNKSTDSKTIHKQFGQKHQHNMKTIHKQYKQ